MEIEFNDLINHFTNNAIQIQGVYYYTVPSGNVGSQISAPFPGFIFPLRGNAEYHFNGTPYTAYIGNVIHGGANMNLDKRVIGDSKWTFISVLYDLQTFRKTDFSLPDTHFELSVRQSLHLTTLLRRLWQTFNESGVLPVFQTENLFRRILEEIFICACPQKDSNAQELFEQVSSYIHNHYMEDMTVHSLAEYSGVNENRLFYVFNKYTGGGPGDYLITYRLNRAKEMLTTCNVPIQEVARNVGYSDALYFSRIFRKRFGTSPSSFREQFRNNPSEF